MPVVAAIRFAAYDFTNFFYLIASICASYQCRFLVYHLSFPKLFLHLFAIGIFTFSVSGEMGPLRSHLGIVGTFVIFCIFSSLLIT
jgi:hypothetical protein